MVRRLTATLAVLAGVASMAGAVQTAQLASRIGVQTGIIGGYQSSDDYVGGLGALVEMEYPLSKSLGIGLEAAGGENAADGPLVGGGLNVKYVIPGLKGLKGLELSAIGFGRGFYQFSPETPSYFFYGGGAELPGYDEGRFPDPEPRRRRLLRCLWRHRGPERGGPRPRRLVESELSGIQDLGSRPGLRVWRRPVLSRRLHGLRHRTAHRGLID